jgi:hypothetical protein
MRKYYYSRFIAILLLTDNVSSWIERTPSPVLTKILLWTCGSYFEWDGEHLELDHRHMPRVATYAGYTFLDTRTRLQLVCCEWHALVMGCGDFWSSYMVKPLESRHRFHEWTRHMTAVPSHIAIALPPVRVPASACLDPVLVEDLIGLLRGQAQNCATLVIAMPDTPSLPALSEGIRDVSFPAVRRLAVVVCDPRNNKMGRRRPGTVVNQPLFGALSAARFSPSTLRLEGFGLSWSDARHSNFANITSLSLQFLGPEATLPVQELHVVFESAIALERMSIHGVHAVGMCIASKRP